MIELRPLVLADLPLLMAIEQAANPYPWSEGVFRSCFGGQYFSYALLQNDVLQGFYFGQFLGVESQLFNICVAPTAQGKGFGKQLLGHYIEQCLVRNALEAWLEVRAGNTTAIQLYQKLGFIETGRRANYYVGPQGREDAILMCLPLAL
ncbi:ribosomal protein S18-alanine N-acetyltransferase [Alishewanella longhuensis]